MIRKMLLFLFLLLMVTVPTSYAAVTVTIDDYTKAAGDTVTIPVTVSGYTQHFAGEFIFNFGKAKLNNVKVEGGTGTLYVDGLADYSTAKVMADWNALTGWWASKDAAIDYGTLGSEVRIYLWAPDKTASGDGVVFNIKGTLDAAAKSDIIGFGGKVFNASKSLRKTADTIVDQAKLNIQGLTPVQVVETVTTSQETELPVAAAAIQGAPVTATVTMKNEDYDTADIKVEAQITGGTQFKNEDGSAFTGFLKPPEAKAYTTLKSTGEEKFLPTEWQSEADGVKITLGDPTQKVLLTQNLLMLLKAKLKTKSPKVYYMPPNGSLELAGVDGTATVGGKAYSITKGGYIIGSSASGSYTDYTIAVLLDHLSDYLVGPEITTAAAAAEGGGGGGTCFIATAAFGSPYEWHVKTLRDFRDAYLLKSSWGKAFVDAYYRYSPPFASYIANHDALKAVVRTTLVPVAGFAYMALYHPLVLLMALLLLCGLAGYAAMRKRP